MQKLQWNCLAISASSHLLLAFADKGWSLEASDDWIMLSCAATVRQDISGAQNAVEEPGAHPDNQQKTPFASQDGEGSPNEAATSEALDRSADPIVNQAALQERHSVHQREDAAALEIDPTPAERQDTQELPTLKPVDRAPADAAEPSERYIRSISFTTKLDLECGLGSLLSADIVYKLRLPGGSDTRAKQAL